MLVLDCSILMAWVTPDESSDYARAVREAITQHALPLIVPPLFFIEVINVLDVMERRKRMSEAQAEKAVQLLRQLPVTVDTESLTLAATWRVRELMRQYGLTAYDASYLELAKRRNITLSTLDKTLRKSAESETLFFVASIP